MQKTKTSIHSRVKPLANAITAYVADRTPSENNRAFKMSSNENPLEPSKSVILSAREGLKGSEQCPDIAQMSTEAQVAKVRKLKQENLVSGNSSDEFFHSVCSIFLSAGDESIMCEHSLLQYKSQVLASGAIPVAIKETNGKIKIQDIIRALNNRTKLVFITVPANPTGTFLTLRELHLLRRLLPIRTALLIDSAYNEFVADDRYYQRNITITRTFSKVYGPAAIRADRTPAEREHIAAANKARSPFNISSIAQTAEAMAISDSACCAASAKFNLF